jgi:hypothetical protein
MITYIRLIPAPGLGLALGLTFFQPSVSQTFVLVPENAVKRMLVPSTVIAPAWNAGLNFTDEGWTRRAENPEDWELDNLSLGSSARRDGSLPPFWWEKLVREHDFGRRVRARWLELRTGALATDSVMAFIEAMADTLSEAQARNFEL